MGRFGASLAIGAALLGAAGCGGGGGSCTPGTDISGIWDGRVTQDDVERGAGGAITATITQNQCTLGGTWNFAFENDAQLDKQFSITGGAPAPGSSAVNLNLEQCIGLNGSCDTIEPCVYVVTGTLVSPTDITGTFQTGDNCSFSENGSFDITLLSRITPTPVPTGVPTGLPIPTVTPTRVP